MDNVLLQLISTHAPLTLQKKIKHNTTTLIRLILTLLENNTSAALEASTNSVFALHLIELGLKLHVEAFSMQFCNKQDNASNSSFKPATEIGHKFF